MTLERLYIEPSSNEIYTSLKATLHDQGRLLQQIHQRFDKLLVIRICGLEWRVHQSLWTPIPQEGTISWWIDRFSPRPMQQDTMHQLALEMTTRWKI